MIKDNLLSDLKTAQKEKDAVKVSVLRMLLSELHNSEIEQKKPLEDGQVVAVLSKLKKRYQDSITQFQEAGRSDLLAKEQGELEVLKKYLPEALSEEKTLELVKQAIEETQAKGVADFGKVMKQVMAQAAGRADGAVVSKLVKEQLNGG